MKNKYESIAALMELDERGELEDTQFDDELWMFVANQMGGPEDRERFADPVVVYFASRFLEWEVGNGGFAQAAYNIPEWFPLAAWGYDQLGLEKAGDLIREAISLLSKENRENTFTASDIGELFSQFSESELAKLDKRLDECGWWAMETRLKYVRENRASFSIAVTPA
jgi:hypothetical protein